MKVLVLFDLRRPPAPDEEFTPQVLVEQERKPTEADVLCSLERLGHNIETLAVFNDVSAIVEKVKACRPDVVFNLLESFHDDRAHEPNVPALLELMKVRYTGTGPDGLMLCKDKALAKKLLAYHHVRVPRFVTSHRSRPLRRLRRVVFPAFVKPVCEEASEGIAKASLALREEEALERARFIHEQFHSDALIEEYIEGRELYASVMGRRRLAVLPPRELFFGNGGAPQFATSKVKWDDAYREKWGIRNGPAGPLSAEVAGELNRVARRTCKILKIRGFGRIDVRLTSAGEIVLLEANPNPSLAQEDDFAQSAATAGIGYDALIQRILDASAA